MTRPALLWIALLALVLRGIAPAAGAASNSVTVVLCGSGAAQVTITLDLGGKAPPARDAGDCLAHCLGTAPALAGALPALPLPRRVAVAMALPADALPLRAGRMARANPARAPPPSAAI